MQPTFYKTSLQAQVCSLGCDFTKLKIQSIPGKGIFFNSHNIISDEKFKDVSSEMLRLYDLKVIYNEPNINYEFIA